MYAIASNVFRPKVNLQCFEATLYKAQHVEGGRKALPFYE